MEGQQPPVTVNAPITVTVNGAPVGHRRRCRQGGETRNGRSDPHLA